MEFEIKEFQKALIYFQNQIVLYTTGCGSKALEWFTALSGSSAYALECANFYSKGSLLSVLNKNNENIEKFVSMQVASDLASEALSRSHSILKIQCENDPQKYQNAVGVGMTGTIASGAPKQGLHHVYLTFLFFDARYTYYIVLDKGKRSREEEDFFVSAFLYYKLVYLILTRNQNDFLIELKDFPILPGDSITELENQQKISPINLQADREN